MHSGQISNFRIPSGRPVINSPLPPKHNQAAVRPQSTYLNVGREKITCGSRSLPRFVGAGRKQSGMAAVELGAAALIMIAVVAFALNICFALITYNITDHACRDAARAAAQGSTSTEARNLAERILRTYNQSGSLMGPLSIADFRYEDFGGAPPAGTSPFVVVRTSCSASMPAPVTLLGQTVFGRNIPLQKTYAFPIVRLTVTP